MSEITYTKGEWKLTAGRTIETEHGTFYITYGLDRDRNPLWKGSFSELDRNVQLMSAAPDLLAACIEVDECWHIIHTALKRAPDDEHTTHAKEVLNALQSKCQIAITKTKGL